MTVPDLIEAALKDKTTLAFGQFRGGKEYASQQAESFIIAQDRKNIGIS